MPEYIKRCRICKGDLAALEESEEYNVCVSCKPTLEHNRYRERCKMDKARFDTEMSLNAIARRTIQN